MYNSANTFLIFTQDMLEIGENSDPDNKYGRQFTGI